MRGRCPFIRGRPLEVRKWCPTRSASSTIEGSTTLDMTSTSTATADIGDTEERGYSAHRGGRYDNDEDRMGSRAARPPSL